MQGTYLGQSFYETNLFQSVFLHTLGNSCAAGREIKCFNAIGGGEF